MHMHKCKHILSVIKNFFMGKLLYVKILNCILKLLLWIKNYFKNYQDSYKHIVYFKYIWSADDINKQFKKAYISIFYVLFKTNLVFLRSSNSPLIYPTRYYVLNLSKIKFTHWCEHTFLEQPNKCVLCFCCFSMIRISILIFYCYN